MMSPLLSIVTLTAAILAYAVTLAAIARLHHR